MLKCIIKWNAVEIYSYMSPIGREMCVNPADATSVILDMAGG